MRIKYKKIICSTDIAPSILIKKIIAKLDKSGYRIIDQTQNTIEFKFNLWRFGSRAVGFKRIDGGEFHIDSESKTVVFSYYLSPMFEIFMTAFAIYCGITQEYQSFVFFMVFIVIMFIVRIIVVKSEATDMMENILYQD